MTKKEKKQLKFSKLIVTTVIIFNVVFAGLVLYIFFKVGSEPTSLIASWFSFTTIELWSLASIKKEETKEENIIKDDYVKKTNKKK